MIIFDALLKIANRLDAKGLFAEASELDAIIKDAIGYQTPLAPGMMSEPDPSRLPAGGGAGGLPAGGGMPYPAPTTEQNLQRMNLVGRFSQLNKVRKMLDLKPKPMPPKRVLLNWKKLPQSARVHYSPYDRAFVRALKAYPNAIGKSPKMMAKIISKQQQDAAAAGKGQQKPPQPPQAPQTQADPAVAQEQGVNQLFNDAVKSLQSSTGVNVSDPEIRKLIMQAVRTHSAGGFNVALPEHRAKLLPMVLENVRRDIGPAFDRPMPPVPQKQES